MYKHIINPVETAKKVMDYFLKEGMVVCDCTVGNGNDTIYLANKVGETGKVYGFDIQSLAINNTKNKLVDNNLINRVNLILDGHENLDQYIKSQIDFFIYNLGYLPSGDKELVTDLETSLLGIRKSLKLLKKNGLLLVTCYIGHEGGLEEKEGVESYLSNLNQKEYNVLEFNFKNQKHNPPILYGVEKK